MGTKVIVAGGGIGGLTGAIALARVGCEVEVFERAPADRPEGSGITVQANAMLVMRELGLEARLLAEGRAVSGGALFDARGRVLGVMDMAAMAPPGVTGVAIHRTRLLDTLREACPAPVHHRLAVEGFEDTGESVRVRLSDGSVRTADALVGADGLRSKVREALFGDEPLRYAGYTTWRGIADVELPGDAGTGEHWGAGARFGVVPIGHGQTYWFAVRNAPAGGVDGPELHAELEAVFADWAEPVRAVLAATAPTAILRTDTFDRPPSTRWGAGRVTLLGDAAHPMTPNLGQGAGQAIEDALVLARHLQARPDDVPEALRRYEAQRQPRTAWVVDASWQMGAIGQWQGAVACSLRNLMVRLTPASAMRRRMAKLYAPALEAA